MLRPTEVQTEQVRELLAPKTRSAGRRRADFAATARWLRALRSRPADIRASSRSQAG